jgi:hypothetical protein
MFEIMFQFPQKGSESMVYEAQLNGARVAAKKPVLSTSEDLDKFHYQLQLQWFIIFPPSYILFVNTIFL